MVAGALVRLGFGPSCDLGRSLDKFRTVGDDLASLNAQVHRFAEAFTGSAHLPASYKFGSGPTPEPSQPSHVQSSSAPKVGIRKVDSTRVKWDLRPSFDPLPYLGDGELRAAYLGPEVLRLPKDRWPVLPRAKVHASPSEFLKLLQKWDAVGALSLLPEESTDASVRCGMFPVYKDEDFDRLILNPAVVNSRMRSICRHTKFLGQGFLLTRIQLRDNERLVISGDDLGEFYYTFKVSSARARRSALAVVCDAEDFREFDRWDPALAGRRVVSALAALAMGDSLAVELAQASHLGLLQKEVGACRASELVVYRAPFPRGPFWEILAIDDHVGIQAVSPSTSPSARRDGEVFQKADTVYPAVGLCQHPIKKIREADNHTVVGGEIEGRIGTIAAPRLHTAVLIALTLEQIRLRSSTPRLFTCLVSCWVQVFLYRRPLLSIFAEVFRVHSTVGAARSAPGGEAVFVLTPVVVNELLCACLLAPFASTNLPGCVGVRYGRV